MRDELDCNRTQEPLTPPREVDPDPGGGAVAMLHLLEPSGLGAGLRSELMTRAHIMTVPGAARTRSPPSCRMAASTRYMEQNWYDVERDRWHGEHRHHGCDHP